MPHRLFADYSLTYGNTSQLCSFQPFSAITNTVPQNIAAGNVSPKTSPAAKSEEKRMFSQATQNTTLNCGETWLNNAVAPRFPNS